MKNAQQLGRVHLVQKRLTELKPAPYNPRKISEKAAAALDASVSRYGLVEPIVWNKRTKRVVGGHQRLEGLRRRGVKVTDVVVVDLPPIEEKTLNLALNSASLGGEFTPAVAEILEEIRVATPEVIEPLLLDDIEIPSAEDEGPEEPPPVLPATRWSIIVECASEAHQKDLLGRFKKEGLKARGMKA